MKYDEDSILQKLELKFAPPAFAFFGKVKSSVGFAHRTADGIAVACWRSRGLEIQGFEIKCSRADWLRELKHPEKADPIFVYCDRWWLVACELEVLRKGELPATWGLMVPNGAGMKTLIDAPKLTPALLERDFVTELLRRRFQDENDPPRLRREYKQGFDAGVEQEKSQAKHDRENFALLKKQVDDFRKASGITISQYGGGTELGQAVQMVRSGVAGRAREDLKRLFDNSKRIVAAIEEEIKREQSPDVLK